LKLEIGLAQVLVLALLFPPEIIALPNVGETLAATSAGDVLLESETLAGKIGGCRMRMAKDLAQIVEVSLCARAFR
jgi:hypothetical protein